MRSRGGLVFKAHRFLYHSTLGSRVIKKRQKKVMLSKVLRAIALCRVARIYRGTSPIRQAPPKDPTVGPCPGSWGGSRGVGMFLRTKYPCKVSCAIALCKVARIYYCVERVPSYVGDDLSAIPHDSSEAGATRIVLCITHSKAQGPSGLMWRKSGRITLESSSQRNPRTPPCRSIHSFMFGASRPKGHLRTQDILVVQHH